MHFFTLHSWKIILFYGSIIFNGDLIREGINIVINEEKQIISKRSPMNNPAPFNLPEIGKRLRTIRAYQRKTQSAMAKELGISLSHYSKLEIGIGGMSRGLAFALCRQFEVPEQWLLYGEGEQPDLASMTAKNTVKAAPAAPPQQFSEDVIVKIVDIIEQEDIKPLANQIATAMGISRSRAIAMLVKEKLRNEEEKN